MPITSQKFYIIPEKEVKGNLHKYQQKYSFAYLPRSNQLSEKLVLNVISDVSNSLRFENEIQFIEFLEDSVFSYITFLELKRNPQFREDFRMSQLDNIIRKISDKCYDEWKNSKLPHFSTVERY